MKKESDRATDKVVSLAAVKLARTAQEHSPSLDPSLQARIAQARLFEGRLRELREAVAHAEQEQAQAIERAGQARAELEEAQQDATKARLEADESTRHSIAVRVAADRAERRVHGLTEAIHSQWVRNTIKGPPAFALAAVGWACMLSTSLPTQALGAAVGLIGLGWLARHLAKGVRTTPDAEVPAEENTH